MVAVLDIAGVEVEQAPARVELNFKSQKLCEMFGDNCNDLTNPPKSERDEQNQIALEEQAGAVSIKQSYIGQNEALKKSSEAVKLIHGVAAFSQVVNFSNNPNFNIHLSGIKLDDPHLVKITDDNVLMVRGDGPESELREATLDEKIQIEVESGACSIGMTREELDMQAYLKGGVDQIPDSLHQLAEENGYLAEDLSRDDFNGLLDKEFAENPHITARISSPLNSEAGLLPPQQSFSPAPAPMM